MIHSHVLGNKPTHGKAYQMTAVDAKMVPQYKQVSEVLSEGKGTTGMRLARSAVVVDQHAVSELVPLFLPQGKVSVGS